MFDPGEGLDPYYICTFMASGLSLMEWDSVSIHQALFQGRKHAVMRIVSALDYLDSALGSGAILYMGMFEAVIAIWIRDTGSPSCERFPFTTQVIRLGDGKQPGLGVKPIDGSSRLRWCGGLLDAKQRILPRDCGSPDSAWLFKSQTVSEVESKTQIVEVKVRVSRFNL